jgi:23S rRNA (adenine2030-N6)-methyltransferase
VGDYGGGHERQQHFVLSELLAYYRKKDKPWTYIDTHAGAGCYAPGSGTADKTGEFAKGFGQLWGRGDLPEPLAAYVEVVRQFNPGGRLLLYPGSPAVAMTFARERDNLQLFELHPEDLRTLRQTFSTEKQSVHVRGSDGLAGLDALLPPPSRRAVVLIDPSYEVKTDYSRVVTTLARALRRFATGCFMLWYPLLARPESRRMPKQLAELGAGSWLDVRFRVGRASSDGLGMFGSGLYVINPPWVLPERLQAVLPWLVGALGTDDDAGFDLDCHIE